jgi:hypothetical protein
MSKTYILFTTMLVGSMSALLLAEPIALREPARPSLDLKAAIDCAEKFAKDERIDLSKHFMFSVNLVTKLGMGRDFEWRVVWDQAQKADDDEIELSVQMDKKVTRLFRG